MSVAMVMAMAVVSSAGAGLTQLRPPAESMRGALVPQRRAPRQRWLPGESEPPLPSERLGASRSYPGLHERQLSKRV